MERRELDRFIDACDVVCDFNENHDSEFNSSREDEAGPPPRNLSPREKDTLVECAEGVIALHAKSGVKALEVDQNDEGSSIVWRDRLSDHFDFFVSRQIGFMPDGGIYNIVEIALMLSYKADEQTSESDDPPVIFEAISLAYIDTRCEYTDKQISGNLETIEAFYGQLVDLAFDES